jgi:hypothetical protein
MDRRVGGARKRTYHSRDAGESSDRNGAALIRGGQAGGHSESESVRHQPQPQPQYAQQKRRTRSPAPQSHHPSQSAWQHNLSLQRCAASHPPLVATSNSPQPLNARPSSFSGPCRHDAALQSLYGNRMASFPFPIPGTWFRDVTSGSSHYYQDAVTSNPANLGSDGSRTLTDSYSVSHFASQGGALDPMFGTLDDLPYPFLSGATDGDPLNESLGERHQVHQCRQYYASL